MKKILSSALLLFWAVQFSFAQGNEKTFLEKATPDLVKAFQKGENEFWIMFTEQADLSFAKTLRLKEDKGQFVFDKLTETASRVQAPFISLLNKKMVSYQSFWAVNAICVKGDMALAKEIAAYDEVKELLPNPKMRMIEPVEMIPDALAKKDATMVAIEWGITKTKADQIWAMGFKGQGVVVGGQDTGYEWFHLALQEQYRGWNGIVADHNFNWHDAIHSGSGGSCGKDSKIPCDDHNHGTHTMGTICGDDLIGNQVGMAPKAKWIGARNMNVGAGTPTTYIECFQWFLAPTDLNNQNPTPSKAPHVINNSWGCDNAEGCNSSNWSNMETVVNNLKAAGIVVVVSAGNDGSGCNTVNGPPAHFKNSFTVGSTTSSDAMSSFSSRGNVNIDGSGRIKPDISAPGSSIRSCIRQGAFATYSGTSMAGPQVAGAVALLISAVPSLAGQVDTIESILEKTAVKITSSQTCNGTSPSTYPNNTVGHGRIDLLAAINYALNNNTTSASSNAIYNKGVSVFPTPANDKFFFRFENFRDVDVVVSLMNTTGQEVFNEKRTTQNNALEISVEELPKGFYFYSVKTNGIIYNGKFIKG